MSEKKGMRRHSAAFRVEIAERMLAGENIVELSRKYELARSMMYRWRDAFRSRGAAGLAGVLGRPGGAPATPPPPHRGNEDKLRQQIAELQRQVGQQAGQIDFFKGVFRRLEELPKTPGRGGTASTRKSGE